MERNPNKARMAFSVEEEEEASHRETPLSHVAAATSRDGHQR
jgi:hypothetical protein